MEWYIETFRFVEYLISLKQRENCEMFIWMCKNMLSGLDFVADNKDLANHCTNRNDSTFTFFCNIEDLFLNVK